jgi:hypothetical protein
MKLEMIFLRNKLLLVISCGVGLVACGALIFVLVQSDNMETTPNSQSSLSNGAINNGGNSTGPTNPQPDTSSGTDTTDLRECVRRVLNTEASGAVQMSGVKNCFDTHAQSGNDYSDCIRDAIALGSENSADINAVTKCQ